MKTIKLILTLALIMIAGLYLSNAHECSPQTTTTRYDFTLNNEVSNGKVVRVILKDGEILPLIELPTIEITAERSTKHKTGSQSSNSISA